MLEGLGGVAEARGPQEAVVCRRDSELRPAHGDFRVAKGPENAVKMAQEVVQCTEKVVPRISSGEEGRRGGSHRGESGWGVEGSHLSHFRNLQEQWWEAWGHQTMLYHDWEEPPCSKPPQRELARVC